MDGIDRTVYKEAFLNISGISQAFCSRLMTMMMTMIFLLTFEVYVFLLLHWAMVPFSQRRD